MSWDYTETAPGVINPPALTGTAPDSEDPAALTNTAPGSTNPPALSNTAPGQTTPLALTDQPPATEVWGSEDPASLPSMPASFQPAFIEVSGVGPTLKALNANAADAAAGKIVQGTVGGVLKSYQVRAGTDDEDLPGIVHPANFNADTNAVVFVQL